MKKLSIGLSLALLSTMSVQAADSLEEAFSNAKTSGQVRAFYITRDRSGTVGDTQTDRSALAAGGHLKVETAPVNGLSAAAAFYTTHSLGFDSDTFDKVNPSLYGEDKEGYSILGEAYLKYATGNTSLTIGRQKLNTPLAGGDDARMLPSLFEAAVLANTDVPDTTLIAAHVTKFAAGTFSNQYGGGVLGVTAGYSLVNAESGRFTNMGKYAIGEDTDGVTAVAAIYKGIPNTTLQIWDYYAHDILNAIYAQADVKWKCLFSDSVKPYAAAQLISESDVGSNSVINEVDSSYYAVKAGAKVGAFGAYAAYSQSDSNTDAAANGGVITPWGGMPAFTQGMVTRHMFLADTSAFKVAGSYNFKELGLNLNTAFYYTSFDVGAENGLKDTDWEAEEFGFDFKYYPAAVKNLQLRLRGNFPSDFVTGLDWDEYRFIVNYNF